MYNCLRFCRRLINSYSLEPVHPIRQNGRIYSNKKIISRYSVLSGGNGITERGLPESVSNYNELVSYVSNEYRIPVEKISQLFTTIKDDNLSEKQVLDLLEYCNNSAPRGNIMTKHNLCQSVLKKYESTGKFSEKVYESFIIMCTENKQCLDVKSVISSLGSNVTQNILKLLLKNVCEYGNELKALEVLSEMKSRGFGLDEEIFNYLILAHTIQGGLRSGLKIFETMNMTKIKESSDSYFFLIKGLAQRDDFKEFADALERYNISYSEHMILSLLNTLGFKGNHMWAKILTKYVDRSLFSRYFVAGLEKLCVDLIQNNKFDAAFEIYKVFVEVHLNGTYGNFILTEMLLSSAPEEKIVEFGKELKESGLNEYALETITGLALKNKLFNTALYFFSHLDTLKPHYFWPLVIKAQSNNGEIGVLDIVHTAQDMKVKFDSESLSRYIFPQFTLKDPVRVIHLFQAMDYTVKDLLTPMILALFRKKEIRLANEVWEHYKVVSINPDDIIGSLSITWLSTVDHKVCVTILRKICEMHGEAYTGRFLIDTLSKMRKLSRICDFVGLLRELKVQKLMIDTATVDSMWTVLKKDSYSRDRFADMEIAVNDIIDFSKVPTVQYYVHPKDMNTEQLELHLIELKSKGMETRGILRKLIQKYAGQGQGDRVKELREELMAKGYVSSPGVKSAVMHSHIQEGDLEEALEIYEELTQSSGTFNMDIFKVIDLATLLVVNNRLDRAVKILKQTAVKNGVLLPNKSTERNCNCLLKSVQDINLQKKMFNLLIDCGYCAPTNIILGSLIQVNLEKGTLENTVDMFVDLTKKYKKTPMHVLLLAKVLDTRNNEMLQNVLNAIASVHGPTSARTSLIAALCEKGLTKQLITLLQEPKIYTTKDIEHRYDRWVLTNNMKALQTLLTASKELPPKLLNIPKIQLSIMKLYSRQNDCDGALAFWKSLVDEDDCVDTEVDNEFCQLLNRCKFNSPENLNRTYKIK